MRVLREQSNSTRIIWCIVDKRVKFKQFCLKMIHINQCIIV